MSNEIYVLAGDINIHLDTDDSNAVHIKEIFNMFNLKQYVRSPTHKLGHTIDCVLAGSDYPQIRGLLCHDVKLSDHFILSFEVNISVTKSEYKTITYRDTKLLNNSQFSENIKIEYGKINSCDLKGRVNEYNTLMSIVVNKHAPQKTKRIKVVPSAPWFDVEYIELRRRRRKAEKKFKKTGLEVHKDEFVQLRKQTTNLAFNKKREYFTRKVDECGKNTKSLYACVNNLLDIKQNVVLPSH